MPRRRSECELSEEELFLDHEKDTSLQAEIEEVLKPRRTSRNGFPSCGRSYVFLFHLCFLTINVFWSTANVRYQTADRPAQGTIYEPSGAPYLEQQTQYDMPLGVKSPFTTFDRAVADVAWESISMKGGLGWLKVSQEKVNTMQQPSVEFDDGSGYFFGMDVFHQLHCLNYLRKKTILYNHLYPSEETKVEDEQIPPEFHIRKLRQVYFEFAKLTKLAHCIDSIRLSLQCHADLSLVPQRWADGWLEPWAVWTNKHVCRNFNAIRDWAQVNVPKLTGTLHHPELGVVVTGRLNLSALPIWQEAHDPDVVPGHMPVCHIL
ncbi:hypothetical protein N431DRAFT_455970 [Stipitochalara longipes BDJ]|nr:hypothetical protein N431DRAFT_455970 [Stipitochalara longipes BDJ]